MLDLLDRRLVFVTGKGGVGKTSVAAALGVLAADRGKRTLVCEVDGSGSLADFLEVPEAGFEPTEAAPGLFLMTMNTEESLREYLKLQLKVPFLARIGPLARSLDFVASAAPGVKEILTVGKLTWEVRERNWDIVIVDASATGHVVSQLAAPEALNELVKVGRVQAQTRWMSEILGDPAQTGVVIVSAPEEMPVAETIELAGRIEDETNVSLAAVVVNKVLPELFGRAEETAFDRLRGPKGTEALAAAVEGPVQGVLDAARLAVELRRSRVQHLDRLRDELPDGLALLYQPYLFTRSYGRRSTRSMAESLGEELGY